MSLFKSLFGKNDNNKPVVSLADVNNVEELKIKANAKIAIGLPLVAPTESLVSSIVLVVKRHSVVEEAYVFAKKNVDSLADPVQTLGLCIAQGANSITVQALMKDIFEAIKLNLRKEEVMDIIILNGSGLLDAVKEYERALIYTKSI